MKPIKTIVFDLYNTLIEIQEPGHFFLKLYKASQNGFNIDVSSYLKMIMTNDLTDIENRLPKEFSELYKRNLPELEEELDSVVVYDEVTSVLTDLKKDYRIFLISNLASPYQQPVFDKNLDIYFEKMIFSCDYGFLKPDQEIFKEVEQLTSHKPNEILMVGDSFTSDIKGAQQMGWSYLKVNRYAPITEDYEISNLHGIKQRIIV